MYGGPPQDVLKRYEILPGSRTLVVSVAPTSNSIDVKDTKLTSDELIRFFPEKNKTVFAYENEQEVVVGVVVEKHLFVYGKCYSNLKEFKFRFWGQWLDADGKTLGDWSAFLNPRPEFNPKLKIVSQKLDKVKVSRTGGFGFICYDLTQQEPAEARFLKIRVMKDKISQTPMADVIVSNFYFVMELPAVQ